MGYTFINKENRMKMFDFFSNEFNNENDNIKFTVLACKTVNKVAYLAVEKINKITGEKLIFAVVCIISYAKDYYNFGYKDIDEFMHPYYYECPDKILNMLTPTENESAKLWREKCRENNHKIEKMPKLSIGSIIEFENKIRFNNGVNETKFVIKTLKPFRLNLYGYTDANSNWMLYKIPKRILKENPYKIIGDK